VLSSGTYRVSVLVTGRDGFATSLFLLELAPEGGARPLSMIGKRLDELCMAGRNDRECSVGKWKFKALECAGGSVFVAPTADIGKVLVDCKKYELLFLDAKHVRAGFDGGVTH